MTSLIRGHIIRSRFKKLLFINLVTGKEPHQINEHEINSVPRSHIRIVQLKELSLGRLKIDEKMR